VQCRCVRGLGRVRRRVQLPLFELPCGDRLGILAVGRDRAREAEGDERCGFVDGERRCRRGLRDALQIVRVASLLDCARPAVSGSTPEDGAVTASLDVTGPRPLEPLKAQLTGGSAGGTRPTPIYAPFTRGTTGVSIECGRLASRELGVDPPTKAYRHLRRSRLGPRLSTASRRGPARHPLSLGACRRRRADPRN
jgi:hypothetical protein